MWPFKKKEEAPQPVPANQISFSQVDITERFGDNLALAADEWITTSPLNAMVAGPQSAGLPPVEASEDEVYRVAERLSRIRESMSRCRFPTTASIALFAILRASHWHGCGPPVRSAEGSYSSSVGSKS